MTAMSKDPNNAQCPMTAMSKDPMTAMSTRPQCPQ
jgi:hypothetical protein